MITIVMVKNKCKGGIGMWLYFILIFVGLWLLQAWLTVKQMKHYQQTIKEMSRQDEGYLGVGVEKKRLGIGTVLVLVTDPAGNVKDCKVMRGVTVFASFEKCKRFIGAHIASLESEEYQGPLEMAIKNIRKEMEKEQIA